MAGGSSRSPSKPVRPRFRQLLAQPLYLSVYIKNIGNATYKPKTYLAINIPAKQTTKNIALRFISDVRAK